MGRSRTEDNSQTASTPPGPGRAHVGGRIKEHPPVEPRKGRSSRTGWAGSKMAQGFRDSGGQGLRKDRWRGRKYRLFLRSVREKGRKEIAKCTFRP